MKHFSKGFLKDVALLLLVTIIAGSGFSSAVAYAVDTYFGDTLSGLVGEYGEYQLLLHVRQEAKDAARTQLEKLLEKEFPGAKLKEGIAIAGIANFFIALPQKAITKKVFSSLGKYFNDLPGQSGYTVLLEPTVVVEGVQGNIYGQLIEKIERLDHVRFAFRQGGQIYVLLTKPEYSQQVTGEINEILAENQILELRFPRGYKVDPKALGDQLAKALSLELGEQVRNVSPSGRNQDMDSLMETLSQLKGFLESYGTKVEVALATQSKVKRGSLIVFGGDNVVGEPPGEGSLVVEIKSISGRKATGIIQKGNSQKLLGADGREKLDAYLLAGGVVEGRVGEVSLENNRILLSNSLGESQKLLTELARTSREADAAARASLATIETFQNTKEQIEQIEALLTKLHQLLASPLGRIRQEDLDELMEAASATSSKIGQLLAKEEETTKTYSQLGENLEKILAMTPPAHPLRSNLEGLVAAVKLISGADDSLGPLAPQLESWRTSIAKEILSLLRADREGRREQVARLLAATQELTAAMDAVDPSVFAPSLELVAERAKAFKEIDLEGIAQEADKLQRALPQLSDEQITSSLNLLDQYLEGEAAPSEKVSLMVGKGIDLKKTEALVREQLDSDLVTLYGMQVGLVKPNMRSEVMRILGEVRLTIAAIFVVLVTILTLIFDHATLIAAFRFWSRNHQHKRQKRRRLEAALPYLYGSCTGALLLWGMTLLTGAQLPLVPRSSVIFLGAAFGLFTALFAEKLSPINRDEMVAGEAMGLTGGEVLQQIVIPAARPGIMQILNQRKVILGRKGGS
jgi:hypothetical protein